MLKGGEGAATCIMFSDSSLLIMLLTYFVAWCVNCWGENRYRPIVHQTVYFKIMGSCMMTTERNFEFLCYYHFAEQHMVQ